MRSGCGVVRYIGIEAIVRQEKVGRLLQWKALGGALQYA